MATTRWILCLSLLWMIGFAGDAALQGREPQQRSERQRQATVEAGAIPPPVGAEPHRLNEDRQIRTTLAAIVHQLVSDDGGRDVVDFDGMVGYLTRPDRWRIGDVETVALPSLTAAVDALRAQWRNRFDADVADIDRDEVFADLELWEGRIADPMVFMTHWPVWGASASRRGGEPAGAGPTSTVTRAPDPRAPYYETGMDVAVARFGTGAGGPGFAVSLVNERFDRWRIDIPDGLDAAAIIGHLDERLRQMTESAGRWPEDVHAAHRVLAQEVLKALYGDESKTLTE